MKEWHPKCETCGHWDNRIGSEGYRLLKEGCPMDVYFAAGIDPKAHYCSDHTTLNPAPTEDKP